MKKYFLVLVVLFSFYLVSGQDYQSFPSIKKENLLNDLEILQQGLDLFHSGMYWYTPKDSVDMAFNQVRNTITKDLNVLEFHKLIAPLVSLSREGHTNLTIPDNTRARINKQSSFIPLTFVFLRNQLYILKNGSNFKDYPLEGKVIESINGERPIDVVEKLSTLIPSDGFIKSVQYTNLQGFNFSKYYFYYYGELSNHSIKFKNINEPILINSLKIEDINSNVKSRSINKVAIAEKDLLAYKLINDSIAYLGIHSFSNSDIKDDSKEKRLDRFLEKSFKSIGENNIKTLIIDISKNSGGSEGNEGLLYSYFGDNYQKYDKVKVKASKAVLDNGLDEPIVLKSLGFFERLFQYSKKADGSLERKLNSGHGLMAFKKEPENKFNGKVYVIIGPTTYSGGSEFANMMVTNGIGTFIGQETGGGYYGNTSGYSQQLILPNSQIEIKLPALQFVMNVKPYFPFGSGVKPHYQVIPTFDEFINRKEVALDFILELERTNLYKK